MGLRFRKSIKIFPGVRVNFGTTGMSVSAGGPGFRKTIHTSGKVTTSVGIPGTGIYYVDTKGGGRSKSSGRKTNGVATPTRVESVSAPPRPVSADEDKNPPVKNTTDTAVSVVQLDEQALRSIHKTSDDAIDWTEVLVSACPPDDSYNSEMWSYYHEVASNVLSGDIDTYLQIIYEVNPLDDLMIYGSNFEFGTDNPSSIEVEFDLNVNALDSLKKHKTQSGFYDLLQDYACSVAIRVARDMFALLPIDHCIVHTVIDGKTILSVDFDRATLSKIKFGFVDPSDTICKFRNNMKFSEKRGFEPVNRLV